MIKDDIYRGSDVKLNVHVDPFGGFSMSDYNFSVELFTGKGKIITIDKSEAKKLDNDNYMVVCNSTPLGLGRIIGLVRCEIPDSDFEELKRIEIVRVDTGINIIDPK